MDVGEKRSKPGVLACLARGQAHGTRSPAVKGSTEGDNGCPTSGMACQFYGRLGSLGAGIGEEHPLLRAARSQPRQALAKRRHSFIVEIGATDVQKSLGSILDGGHDLRMTVPGRGDRNTGHEIQVSIAVHILDHDSAATGNDQRVLLGVAGGGPLRVLGYDRLSLGPGRGDDDVGIVADGLH
jgi:hypothetical protein